MPRALQRAIKFFQFLPLESEIQGVFKPVARKILHGLQNIECIPVQRERPSGIDEDIFDVDWVKPSQVLLGDPLLCKTILPSELKEYLDLSYISNVMTKNVNPALLKCLGIKAESLDILVELCRSHLKKIAAEKGTFKMFQTICTTDSINSLVPSITASLVATQDLLPVSEYLSL